MPRDSPESLLARIEAETYAEEGATLAALIEAAGLDGAARARIAAAGADLVRRIRTGARPGMMETFLAEYGLSTAEGVALMCLAEALLRVPDAGTVDALIEDKIAPSDWGRHLGRSASPMVNASTWALMLTGRVLDDDRPWVGRTLHGAVKRLGEPVIRRAVGRAMREMGRQFVLGEDIGAAMRRAEAEEAKGYAYSYDMLGEAARTDADARRYFDAYSGAIAAIGRACTGASATANPGISVKFSALFPRYEVAQRDRVLAELVPRVQALARAARAANMGFNIDAEEAGRLTLSLAAIEAVAGDPELAGWDGFGVVVQAYGQRAAGVIDWAHDLACRLDRRLTLRLVKGAYWDSEIKAAQIKGVAGFPVFTRKAATDVSYIACARKLLGLTDRIYPQFATHNAHTVAAILDMGADPAAYEFQRLHGMGERLHDTVMAGHGTRCRIYAPVGAHRDLLAYLVRRLLENGANSSFVNRIVDASVPPEEVAADPVAEVAAHLPGAAHPAIRPGPALYLPDRANSQGWDLAHGPHLAAIDAARGPSRAARFTAGPVLAGGEAVGAAPQQVTDPANPEDIVGEVTDAAPEDVAAAFDAAAPWQAEARDRAAVLTRAADLYEAAFGPLFAVLAREAGKTLPDAVAELREAADFLRYYAGRAEALPGGARGVFACISPWNFPLAIFTGQIAAALAAGNAVLAKPAEATPLVAAQAVALLHRAGVPRTALQFLPGDGAGTGAALTADARLAGVAFTGSLATARAIRQSLAEHAAPGTPLIAETGGINAMVVDSTALPEQAVADVLASAFQSAGQRCSALRCLYVQADIADGFEEMLLGAMAELSVGDPWHLATDCGPLIGPAAEAEIAGYVAAARAEGRVLAEGRAPGAGHFQPPVAIRVGGIADIPREVFGPVLHVARYRAEEIDAVIGAINATGYGLTFGLHTRIDDRVQHLVERIRAGNLYVNRNQVGAIVGSQPFGGEGLSGTGPKAGGPMYLSRFTAMGRVTVPDPIEAGQADPAAVQHALDAARPRNVPLETAGLPGPTGESNRYSRFARLPLLCLGPGAKAAERQRRAVEALGGRAVAVADPLPEGALAALSGFSGAVFWGAEAEARALDRALAARDGPILPLVTEAIDESRVVLERHLSIDTTASGGNAALLAEVSQA